MEEGFSPVNKQQTTSVEGDLLGQRGTPIHSAVIESNQVREHQPLLLDVEDDISKFRG